MRGIAGLGLAEASTGLNASAIKMEAFSLIDRSYCCIYTTHRSCGQIQNPVIKCAIFPTP